MTEHVRGPESVKPGLEDEHTRIADKRRFRAEPETEGVFDDVLRSRIAAHNRAVAPVQAWPRTLAAMDEVYQRARLRSGTAARVS
jgi:hypothetical protein